MAPSPFGRHLSILTPFRHVHDPRANDWFRRVFVERGRHRIEIGKAIAIPIPRKNVRRGSAFFVTIMWSVSSFPGSSGSSGRVDY